MQIGARTTGSLVRVFVTSGGTGYTAPPVVTITGGTGATAHAHLDSTRVQSIAIESGGAGFGTPVVSISPASVAASISGFTASTTNATLTLATAAATTFARIQSGTNSVTISSFANATQPIIAATTFATSGAATLYAAGTGAAATAFAYTGPLRPMSFFKGRFNDIYGVDGMGHGFRWNGVDANVEKLGITKPAVGPALTASPTSAGGYVSAVQMVQGGGGYHSPPTVTITGGTPSEPARARAVISNGRVTRVIVTERGGGYQTTPTVSFSGGIGSGAGFTVSVLGQVSAVEVLAGGGGYTSVAQVTNVTQIFHCPYHGLTAGSSFTFASVTNATASRTISAFTAGTTSNTLTFTASAANTHIAVTAGTSSANILSFANNTQALIDATTFPTSGRATLLAPAPGVSLTATYYVVTASATTFTAGTENATTAATTMLDYDLGRGFINIPGPRVQFSSTGGLTEANAGISVDGFGAIQSVNVVAAGTGLTASTASASVIGGAGTGASLRVVPVFSVASVAVATAGTGYYTPPVLTFRAATADPTGFGAVAAATLNGTGGLSGVTVSAGGQYSAPPSVIILDTEARAQATLTMPMRGKYQCAVRYVDDTPKTERGPIPSDISELVEIDIADPSDALSWTFSHHGLDARVYAMELFRSTSDQSVALYRVATILRTDSAFNGTYVDRLTDPDLQDVKRDGFGVMPIVLPSGQLNARRFGVCPGDFAVAAMFQDRAWFAVDTSGDRPNSLLYSEVDEPESVPAENELILQENTPHPDRIVGLLPLGAQLLIAQSTHLYALSYVSQPILDASLILVAYRGMLNAQCGDVVAGVAVMVDSFGMYAFDGNNAEAVSVPVDNYWRDSIIDFTKADKFHVRADSATMTVRFYYCRSADTQPVRALCYCMNTKAWWEETYPVAITATCPTAMGTKSAIISGTVSGGFLKPSGLTDSGTAVPYSIRTGNMALTADGDRSIAVLYKPTSTTSTLDLSLHYNSSATARPNAIQTNQGAGFVAGATSATLNMSKTRSALGDASGHAKAHYAGRLDDRSAGTDRHLAVAVSGEQSGDGVTLYSLKVGGVE